MEYDIENLNEIKKQLKYYDLVPTAKLLIDIIDSLNFAIYKKEQEFEDELDKESDRSWDEGYEEGYEEAKKEFSKKP